MNKKAIFRGIIADNAVLSPLMVVSPVIVQGTSVQNALAVIYAFSVVTFSAVMLGSFVPSKLPYGAKMLINALIAAVVCIPAKLAAEAVFPDILQYTGVYFALIAVNPLITIRCERLFYGMPRSRTALTLLAYILGFDIVMLLVSLIREIAAYGTVCGHVLFMGKHISGLGAPFGGFILLGIICAIYRSLRGVQPESNGGDGDVSDN